MKGISTNPLDEASRSLHNAGSAAVLDLTMEYKWSSSGFDNKKLTNM
jgi:hypothetical protein